VREGDRLHLLHLHNDLESADDRRAIPKVHLLHCWARGDGVQVYFYGTCIDESTRE
jgi:hypothetical protein